MYDEFTDMESNNSQSKGVISRPQDSEDGIQLTPEQQRQLAFIESMPLTREWEIPQEEWASKTPEEKERIIGEHILQALLDLPLIFMIECNLCFYSLLRKT